MTVSREEVDISHIATDADCQRRILLVIGPEPENAPSAIITPSKSRFHALVVFYLPRLTISVYPHTKPPFREA
jgi:hypothetical protein